MMKYLSAAEIAARREALVNKLNEKGVQAVVTPVEKNGVTMYGITIRSYGEVCPCVYMDEELCRKEPDYEELANKLIETCERSMRTQQFDVSLLSNAEWVKKNLRVAMQRKVDSSVLRRDGRYPETVECLRIAFEQGEDDSFGSILVKDGLLDVSGISVEEAWRVAEENTKKDFVMQNMSAVMEAFGHGEALSDLDFEAEMGSVMFIVSNARGIYGASSILNEEAIRERISGLARSYDRAVCIPSSVHESIIVPLERGEAYDVDEISSMIMQVNTTEVMEEEVLADKPYVMKL